jgi:hypothetical protein
MSQDLNHKANQYSSESLDQSEKLLEKLQNLDRLIAELEFKKSIIEDKATTTLARMNEDDGSNREQFLKTLAGHADTIRSLTEIISEGNLLRISFNTNQLAFAEKIDGLTENATKLDEQLQIVEFQSLATDIAMTSVLSSLWQEYAD